MNLMDQLRDFFRAHQRPDLRVATVARAKAEQRSRDSESKFHAFDAEAAQIEETVTRLRDEGALLD